MKLIFPDYFNGVNDCTGYFHYGNIIVKFTFNLLFI